jgi:hypothetical protein
MPSRPFAFLIVVGWLAALGWFAHRELWHILFPSEAPPFVIELGDEVTTQMGNEFRRRAEEEKLSRSLRAKLRRPDVLWGIYRGENRIGKAETRLRYFDEDNTFEMETRVALLKLKGLVTVEIPEFFTAYRIDRSGEFRGMEVEGEVVLHLPFGGGQVRGNMNMIGFVSDKQVHWRGEIDIGDFKIKPELEPIDAPRGSILNPLHPLPKIKNVRPGRRWRMPVIDPLGDALEPAITAALKKFGSNIDVKKLLSARPQYMDAEVLNDTAEVAIDRTSFPCWVIEFRSEGSVARTYVRTTDGAVLRQEATTRGETIVLQRE